MANEVEGVNNIDQMVPDDDLSLKRAICNSFNFAERKAQTFIVSIKRTGNQTKPPQVVSYVDDTNKWKCYDA